VKTIVSALVFAASVGTLMVGLAAPASATTWACTARDLRDAHFTGGASGPNSSTVRLRAETKALSACKADSAVKDSCVILNCTSS